MNEGGAEQEFNKESGIDFSYLEEKYQARIKPRDNVEGAYQVQFPFEDDIVVTFGLNFGDYTGSDIVITNMTCLDKNKKFLTGKGYGSKALGYIFEWARLNNFHDIRATQVQGASEGFWMKNGFSKDEENAQTNDYIITITS